MSRYVAMTKLDSFMTNDNVYLIDKIEHKIVKGKLSEMHSKLKNGELDVENLCEKESRTRVTPIKRKVAERLKIGNNRYFATLNGLYLVQDSKSPDKVVVDLEEDMTVIIERGIELKELVINNSTVEIHKGAVVDSMELNNCSLVCIGGEIRNLSIHGGHLGGRVASIVNLERGKGKIGKILIDKSKVIENIIVGLNIGELELREPELNRDNIVARGCYIGKVKLKEYDKARQMNLISSEIGELVIEGTSSARLVGDKIGNVWVGDGSQISSINTDVGHTHVGSLSQILGEVEEWKKTYKCIVDYNINREDKCSELDGYRVVCVDREDRVKKIVDRMGTIGDGGENIAIIIKRGCKND